jgi:hypothetical protein
MVFQIANLQQLFDIPTVLQKKGADPVSGQLLNLL